MANKTRIERTRSHTLAGNARPARSGPGARIASAPTEDEIPDAHRLGLLLERISRSCSHTLKAHLQQSGFKLPHWQILVELARLNGCKQGELAARLGAPASSVADALADLERQGWIIRRAEPQDRRVRRIFLRPAAVEMVEQLQDPLRQLSEQMFRDISNPEQELFLSALKRVQARFKDEMPLPKQMSGEEGEYEFDPWLQNSGLVDQRLSILTLAVADVTRSRNFYEHALGWRASPASGETVAFFDLGPIKLALVEQTLLALDSGMPLAPYQGGFRGLTLTHVISSPAEVDCRLARISAAGGRLLRPAMDTFWGGYSGYFADPDGHAWELAASSQLFPLLPDGEIRLPNTEALPEESLKLS